MHAHNKLFLVAVTVTRARPLLESGMLRVLGLMPDVVCKERETRASNVPGGGRAGNKPSARGNESLRAGSASKLMDGRGRGEPPGYRNTRLLRRPLFKVPGEGPEGSESASSLGLQSLP